MDNFNINTQLVSKCIGFHGQPLQKIWGGERGETDLIKIGVVNPDFTAYQLRQKYFSFQDRAKRLKLHQFIAKKADMLFSSTLFNENALHTFQHGTVQDYYSAIPPLEKFLNDKIERSSKLKYILTLLHPGDFIFGTIYSKTVNGMIIRLLCTGAPTNIHFLSDFNAKAFLPTSETIPAIDRKGTSRNYITNDCILCKIIDITPESEKMVVGMKNGDDNGVNSKDLKVNFGLVSSDSLPEMYKLFLEKNGTYDEYLESSINFHNSNSIDILANTVGFDTSQYYTNMSGLRGRFPSQEYGSELRQVQACKWAFRSVAEGIEHFKEGRHSEAFQCLNKALSIDPRNVEGLVARGALYANNGSFKKAVDDFETALKLNQNHANARKYMGETLVALGRSYEDENKIEEAKKAYQDCLNIIPHHEEAKNSLEFIWSKSNIAGSSKQLIEPNELTLPALNIKISEQNRNDAVNSKKEKDKKSKKKKTKNRKRRHSSSSSSSESSESSVSSSATSSSSESSSTDSEHSKHKKKRKSKLEKARQKSLSPLSKRMVQMKSGASDEVPLSGSYHFNQSSSYVTTDEQPPPDEYELRVRKFLELTRDEENYEEKVRKFVEEADKYRKDRKINEEKSKKRDKKKNKKLKKDGKKKKKDKKSKSSKKEKDEFAEIENMEFREALRIFKNLPVFDFNNKIEIENIEKNLLNDIQEKTTKGQEYPKEENKWKMMFNKNESKTNFKDTSATMTKAIPKQYSFDVDNEITTESNALEKNSTTSKFDEKKEKRRPPTPPSAPTPFRNTKYTDNPPPKPPIGQVVLDKFGNFRLATTNEKQPPEPPAPPRRSRSRSRSNQRYSSDSRSRSRSVKRRSHSRSYERRRSRSRSYRSRSMSRSRSYSRSRSGSMDRRRRYRGGRGSYDRGTYYKPRFNQRYGGPRGGRNGGYRDFRDYRARGRDRFRGQWGNNRGGNYRYRRDDSRERRFDRRSRSASFDSAGRKSPKSNRKYSDNENEKSYKKTPPRHSESPKEENWDDEVKTAQTPAENEKDKTD